MKTSKNTSINPDNITLFYAPNSRANSVMVLLEELGTSYDLQVLNLKAGEQRQSAYLAINPMGKVPAILHKGGLVTEQVAVCLYLAELFPESGLSPAPGSTVRGAYLRWMAYYAACYEPALVDIALKREPTPASFSPYGDFDTMLGIVTSQLEKGPYLLGEQLTAADILWANALRWGTMFKLVPELPVIMDYVKRLTARPSFVKAAAVEAAWLAELESADKLTAAA